MSDKPNETPPKNHDEPWTDEDLRRLKELTAAGEETPDIAEKLGRTETAVRSKVQEEGLSLLPRDPDYSYDRTR